MNSADLTLLCREEAQLLASTGWYLNLSGLTDLEADVAEALSQHVGTLSLLGLSRLSEVAAQHLLSHKGPLLITNKRLLGDVLQILVEHPSVNLRGEIEECDDDEVGSGDDGDCDEYDVQPWRASVINALRKVRLTKVHKMGMAISSEQGFILTFSHFLGFFRPEYLYGFSATRFG